MRNFVRSAFILVFMAAILALMAFACGFTPDGILYGQWPASDDHPTNWCDTVLHP
ncbi:MAG TPA: hypothetical protein VKB38_00940 [Terracidiphilus sp.]|nr:hypothetical protein [Terracidiphilus sp.]